MSRTPHCPVHQLDALRKQVAVLQEQNGALQSQNTALLEQNHKLREDNQTLRDEVARLKKQTPKPKIGPSRLTEKERKKRRGRRKGQDGEKLEADRTVVVKAERVPEGSRFKGYDDFWVQADPSPHIMPKISRQTAC